MGLTRAEIRVVADRARVYPARRGMSWFGTIATLDADEVEDAVNIQRVRIEDG